MWEVTLIGHKHDFVYFVLLEESLRKCINEKPIFAISGLNKLYCSIAISDRKNIKSAKKCILEILIKICKEEYFKENMKNILLDDKDLNNFIILSLVSLNLHEEIDYSMIKVKFSKIIHIRSLMKFKLKKLYEIWDKIILYFKDTMSGEMNEKLYLEFLKFLASSERVDSDIMYLVKEKEEMCILDRNKKLLSSVPIADEIGVIVNLIVLSPKKIIINCYNALSQKITGLIEYIFGDKISILL